MTVLDGLQCNDSTRRIQAIGAVRFRDLKDPVVLAALLACAADTTPTAEATGAPADPFAAFFGGAPAGTTGTVADEAVQRLQRAGMPADETSQTLLAEALGALDPASPGPLAEAAVTLLSETRWPDRDAALRAVVPALQRLDVPLYALLVQLPEPCWPTICELATEPWVPRTFNELLNHPPLHPHVVAATEAAAERDTLGIDADQAVSLLATLAAWGDDAGVRLARAWQERWPWTALFAAVGTEEAHDDATRWLSSGAEGAPASLGPRLAETLRHRGPIDGYPIVWVLGWLGHDAGLLEVWPIDLGVASVLVPWTKRVVQGDMSGWTAATLLARSDHFEVVRMIVAAALLDDRLPVPWEPDVLTALAQVEPVVPGLPEALVRGAQAAPDQLQGACSAALSLPPDAQRALVEAVLTLAEAAPEVETRAGRGTVKVSRQGVDVEALEALLSALADPALQERYDAVGPVFRGA